MKTKGKVTGIVANLVIVEVDVGCAERNMLYRSCWYQLMAEVIRLSVCTYVQVFESTRGLRVGNSVEFEEHMLEVTLLFCYRKLRRSAARPSQNGWNLP